MFLATQQPQSESVRAKLPAGGDPLAIAGDERTGNLYALVPGEVLLGLATRDAPADGGTNGVTLAERAPVFAAPPPPYGIICYASDRWTQSAIGPAPDVRLAVCRMVTFEGRLSVFYAASPTGELHFTTQVGEAWTAPQTVEDLQGADLLAARADTNGLALVAARPGSSADRRVLRVFRLDGSQWVSGDPLTIVDSPHEVQANEVKAAFWGDEVVVIEGSGTTPRAGLWPVKGGNATAAPVAVLGFRSPPGAPGEQMRVIVVGVVIAALTLVVFMRRRESFLADMPVPSGYVLARLGRRLSAFLLDLAGVTLLYVPLVLAPWLNKQGIDVHDSLEQQLEALLAREPMQIFWRWMGWAAAVAVYGTVFETLRGATPGKMILGLRVFDNKGRPPRFGSILLRNVLRIELFYGFEFFLPLALLVGLTRNRQRLGDLIANTVVVEKA
jgi:uncharacterized RDD family membrane protein YckC